MSSQPASPQLKSPQLASLPPGAHVHLVGICGTAMASLAGLLKENGFRVSGSDSNPYPPMSTQIENLGIPLHIGYSKNHLLPRPDFAVIGNVITAANEEARAVLELGIPYTSLPKALGELVIADRQSIVIAGTHGKTTTTSLMAWVTDQLGLGPGFLIGGIAKNFSRSFQNPTGDYFVIEGDEYDTAFFDKVPKFVHYRPRHVIFTSCEFDHADIYADLAAVESAFLRLMKLIPETGTLVSWAGDARVQKISREASCRRRFTYGLTEGDYQARILCPGITPVASAEVPGAPTWAAPPTLFEAFFRGQSLGEIRINLVGNYNVLNALAAVALSHALSFDMVKVREILARFQGVKRRQEILGEPDGVLVIEDFAHHPTAVRETLKGLREAYAGRRLWAVFEPRSATSRRKVFQNDYVDAFQTADRVLIAQAFDQSKIAEGERFSCAQLVEDMKKKKVEAELLPNADIIVQEIQASARPGDLVVIMSNGGFDGIYEKLLKALAERGVSSAQVAKAPTWE
ncbi:MAG: UDP-N-acetylmuramate:L-alanyl-gamma-D-glutamyl-meso-diaminopimelate ligase [Bdellovibrio sp.]|nr:MAG: UDP-N-acetylmuramate:L-alanyl-gamma-D-glutamyl-meso-diaminopimelate ligase [Bdellovibrio sp.]